MQRIQDMFINMEEVAEDAYKNTELLLSQYTKVMFRIEKNLVDIDYEMYAEEGKHLKEMLYDLVDFDATAEKRRIQEKLLNNDMNLCLLEIMRDYLICQSGLRSYIASRILEGNGYETYNFSGGFRFYDAVVNDRALIERAYACGMDY